MKGVDPDKKVLVHATLLRYYSTDHNVAAVNEKGNVKARGEGSCSIYVLANNGIRARVQVTVKSAAVPTKLTFQKSRYSVKRRKSLNLANELVVSGDAGKLIWTSSDPAVAVVNDKGVVKGVKKGTVTITVTAKNSGATARTKVQVK